MTDPSSLQHFNTPALNLHLTSDTDDYFLECSSQFSDLLIGYVVVVFFAWVDSFDSVGLWVEATPRTTGRKGHG